ncbi:MAG TPA: hypothetical protein PKX92_09275 [Edaphocola sp.]|nr:hypothetical protein [Edaphocola sp.]
MKTKKNNKFLLYFLSFIGIVLPGGHWLLASFPDHFAKIAAWAGLIFVFFLALGLGKIFAKPCPDWWRGFWGH